jgi:hypothetical protein
VSALVRFFNVYAVDSDGVALSGELYELPPEQHNALLAQEPPELYEDAVLLEDGSSAATLTSRGSAAGRGINERPCNGCRKLRFGRPRTCRAVASIHCPQPYQPLQRGTKMEGSGDERSR